MFELNEFYFGGGGGKDGLNFFVIVNLEQM